MLPTDLDHGDLKRSGAPLEDIFLKFLIVDLRDELVAGDLIYATGISNMLCITKLILSIYLKIIDIKLQ